MACSDVETEPVLENIFWEHLSRGSNAARLDIRECGIWEHQRWTFFDVKVCHLNAESYRDLERQQIYHIYKNLEDLLTKLGR